MIDPLNVALGWAQQGFKVYPLAKNTRKPLAGTHGYLDASNDEAIIRKWWNEERYGVGIDLSSLNVLVVDMDRGHTSGLDGIATYQQLYSKHHFQPLPPNSYIEETPSGGLHWFLSYPQGTPVKTVQSAFCKDSGIDIITTGIPVYPTTINGKTYWPKDGRVPYNIKPAPQWVLDMFKPQDWHYKPSKRSKGWTGQLLDQITAGAPQGQRNVILTRLCGRLFATGAKSETVYELMELANEHVSPPLPDKELNAIYKSILKREVNHT